MTDLPVETSPATSPSDERIQTLVDELELAIRWQRPCILLAVYSSEYVRADAQTLLENQVMDLGQEVVDIRVRNGQGNGFFQFLHQDGTHDNIVYFVEGLRWGHAEDQSLYETLNRRKEFFKDGSIRSVFWLTENEFSDLARRAPDFWGYRHRVVEFAESPSADQVMQQAIESAWQGTGEYAGQYDDTDAKISLRESLLTDVPSREESSSVRANLSLTLGLLNWRKGDFEKADQQLQEALKLAMRIQDNWFEAECFNAIALVKTSMQQIDEAIHAYKQAIRMAPEQVFAWNNLGNLCTKIGRNDEAIITFQKAIDCNPQDPIAWNGLGNVYYRMGYADDAIAAFRKSIQFLPSFAHPWNGLGEVYASVGRTDEAIKAYQKAIELNKQFVMPWLRLGELFARQERYRDAIRAYQRAVRMDARNSSIWNDLGLLYTKVEAWQDAEEVFLKAINIDRSYGWAYTNLAQVYVEQGKLRESVTLLARSIELLEQARDKALAWNRLGNVYRQMNDYDSAVAAYQTADALSFGAPPRPTSEPVGDEPSQAPDEEKAIAVHEADAMASARDQDLPVQPASPSQTDAPTSESTAITATSHIADAPYWIFNQPPASTHGAEPEDTQDRPATTGDSIAKETGGTVMPSSANDNPPEAPSPISVQTGGMEMEADESANAFAWNEKGNVHFKQGEYEEAISAYNKAIQLDPDFGWPYSNLALTYLSQGQHAEAILLYQKSIELLKSDKEKALSWNGLGNVYRALNDYPNAVAAYQKAADLDPQTGGIRDGAETMHVGPGLQSAKVWNDLGEIFLKTGAYGEAASAFNKAISLDPKFGWPYSNLGRALASQGYHAQAIPLYQKSIELFSDKNDKAVSWNRLGNTYRKLNDYDNAIKAFQQAVALNDEGMNLVTRTRFSLLSNCYAE